MPRPRGYALDGDGFGWSSASRCRWWRRLTRNEGCSILISGLFRLLWRCTYLFRNEPFSWSKELFCWSLSSRCPLYRLGSLFWTLKNHLCRGNYLNRSRFTFVIFCKIFRSHFELSVDVLIDTYFESSPESNWQGLLKVLKLYLWDCIVFFLDDLVQFFYHYVIQLSNRVIVECEDYSHVDLFSF